MNIEQTVLKSLNARAQTSEIPSGEFDAWVHKQVVALHVDVLAAFFSYSWRRLDEDAQTGTRGISFGIALSTNDEPEYTAFVGKMNRGEKVCVRLVSVDGSHEEEYTLEPHGITMVQNGALLQSLPQAAIRERIATLQGVVALFQQM